LPVQKNRPRIVPEKTKPSVTQDFPCPTSGDESAAVAYAPLAGLVMGTLRVRRAGPRPGWFFLDKIFRGRKGKFVEHRTATRGNSPP
jgi:hypothetical protein